MNDKETKEKIKATLSAFSSQRFREAATGLLNTLGYRSNLTLELSGNGKDDFLEAFNMEGKFNSDKACFDDWTNISLLFQLTADHITTQEGLFTNETVDKQNYSSYLFFAVELNGGSYARGKLAQITREINKLTKQPAMIVFRHGDSITLAVIDRQPNERAPEKDVLRKVTLIKDINIALPHRAHVEILFDLSLEELSHTYDITSFQQLHDAWRKTLDLKELNNSFYKKLLQWYERATKVIKFPNPEDEPEEANKSINAIRLLTRLIFCWFLKEKLHKMDKLFDKPTVDGLLNYSCSTNSNYYRAILQNLFFATLNVRINERKFRRNRVFQGKMDHYMDHRFYRYASYFKSKDEVFEELFSEIPFLNGGLFECLDHLGKNDKEVRVDCFSENKKNIKKLSVPDDLFFSDDEKQPGIIDILARYKFTIEENTPLEQEIALDPDLLGRTFESLLATYNPETKTPARNATGSFYTPREIVNYMVDESLIAYLSQALSRGEGVDLTPGPSPEERGEETPRYMTTDAEKWKYLKPLAREHRKNPTEAEKIIWQRVRNNQLGVHFRREHAINWFIVDFVCIEKKLVVEIDGEVHKNQKEYDEERTQYLNERGFRVIRFWNDEVIRNADGVIERIRQALDDPTPIPSPMGRGAGEGSINGVGSKLRHLFSYTDEPHQFSPAETDLLIDAISNCKIVDPACGSGAFPMGILDRMVRLLRKLDKGNEKWKLQQLKNAESETAKKIQEIETDIAKAQAISVEKVRKKAVADLEEIKQQIRENFEKQDENYLRKLYLIENCIYGVDIQPIAIEIAKLRFFLSLLVDFRTNDNPKDNYGILPLPNLDYKLMQGNSLLESYGDVNLSIVDGEKTLGIEDGTQFRSSDKEKLRELMHVYFEPANILEKRKIQDKIDVIVERYVMNHADALIRLREQQLSSAEQKLKLARASKTSTKGAEQRLKRQREILELEVKECKEQLHDAHKQKKELLSIQHKRQKPYFLWHLYFMDVMFDDHNPESGFDIVIGNPPYIQLQKDSGKLAELFKDKGFKTFERTGDIYSLFYEQGFNVLKRNGVVTYITSSQWQKASYGRSLRRYFLTKDPLRLLNLGPGVFDSSVVDTNILVAKNSSNRNNLKGVVIRKEEELVALDDKTMQHMRYVTDEAWTILDSAKQTIEQKLQAKGKPLKDWNVKINFGIKTGYNEAFIIDEEKRKELIKSDPKSAEIIKPILRGREIERYCTEWDGGWLIATFPSLEIDISKYKAVKKFLEGFLPKIKQTGESFVNSLGERENTRKKTSNKWFETQDPIEYHEEFTKEKVIWKRIGSQLRFSYSNEEIYCLDSTCIATGEKIKYLTALLNSKLCQYQLFEKSPRTGMGDLIISVQALEPVLVHYPNEQEEKTIVDLFDQILAAKKRKPRQTATKTAVRKDGGQTEADTSALEKEIDRIVYELYGLTEEEIRIVEDSTRGVEGG